MIRVKLAPYRGTLDALAQVDPAFDTANQVRQATDRERKKWKKVL